MDEEQYRCPIHLGYLCFRDSPPFEHNIRLKPEEHACYLPRPDHGFIYRITHIRTGMYYVGRTRRSLSDRWAEHRSARKLAARGNDPLYCAMNEDGLQMFVMEKLEECGNSIARECELDWMRQFDSWNPNKGYNSPTLEAAYARKLYFLLNPGQGAKYKELQESLKALADGCREPSAEDQKWTDDLHEIEETSIRKGRKLMRKISSLTSPVVLASLD